MRYLEFELQLPDGRTSWVTISARNWSQGFSEACVLAERTAGLAANSGIVCRSYRALEIDGAGYYALAA